MKPVFLVASVLALFGCGPTQRDQAEMAAAAQPFLTAQLIRAEIPTRDATAVLRPIGQNGPVTTWTTVDNITLSFSDGVLVASRGLGFDLMGADAAPTRAALRGASTEIYRRKMRYLTGDNHSTWLTAGCTMKHAGVEYSLRRFEETCTARDTQFTNVFWVNNAGQVAQSKQWLSPELGYAIITPFALPNNPTNPGDAL